MGSSRRNVVTLSTAPRRHRPAPASGHRARLARAQEGDHLGDLLGPGQPLDDRARPGAVDEGTLDLRIVERPAHGLEHRLDVGEQPLPILVGNVEGVFDLEDPDIVDQDIDIARRLDDGGDALRGRGIAGRRQEARRG
jgi:hypothetical protein